VKEFSIRPSEVKSDDAKKVAKKMIMALSETGRKEDIGFILNQFENAITSKAVTMRKSGLIKDDAGVLEYISNVKSKTGIEEFKKNPAAAAKQIEAIIDTFDKMGVSAATFMKSLDSIEFETVYDVYGKVLKGMNSGLKPLQKFAKDPGFNEYIRNMEKAVGQVEQLMPIVEPGRPRRAAYQSDVLHVVSRTSPAFAGDSNDMSSVESKKHILDVNLRLREMMDEANEIRRLSELDATKGVIKERPGLPLKRVKTITSLGLPETQISSIIQRGKSGSDEYEKGTEYLEALSGTITKMQTQPIHEFGPFASQAGHRGRAGVGSMTSAMSYETFLDKELKQYDSRGSKGRLKSTYPAVMTETEYEMSAGGRYGTQGYGFNVVAELKNVAGTHEDMVQVSGKLADALTSTIKTKLLPSAGGRLRGKNLGDDTVQVTEAEPALLRDFEKGVVETARTILHTIGSPVKYEGRADKALITEVSKAINIVRSENVEVQAAKIAEVYLNYFGRKFITRHGSKGVSVTPSGAHPDVFKVLESSVGSKDVAGKAGLGYAEVPKTMGELVAKIIDDLKDDLLKVFDSSTLKNLQESFLDSGNKFMLDLFKNVDMGVATQFEAEEQQKLYKHFEQIISSLPEKFKSKKIKKMSFAEDDVKNVIEFKKMFKSMYPKEE
jgi:hypothetical protein